MLSCCLWPVSVSLLRNTINYEMNFINDEMVYEMNHMNCGYEIK